LIGYCFGGLVAYEMAQQLHQKGEKTELLALINAPTPDFDFSKGAPGPPDNQEETASVETAPAKPAPQYSANLFGRVQRGLARRYQIVRLFLRTQGRHLAPLTSLALGKTIPWEHRRAYASYLNDRAQQRYKPSPYPGRLTILRGAGMFFDETTGWTGKAQDGIETHEITGRQRGWIDTLMEPQVAQVAEILEGVASNPLTKG
jgi:thioesterase domain-containing protein